MRSAHAAAMKKASSPSAEFRKKHGIAPIGDGPHEASAYGLPVPPRSHPLSRTYARAVLKHAKTTIAGGKFDERDVARQVRKANVILYGKPAPTAAEKAKAQRARRDRDLAYYASEAGRREREAYISGTVEDSWEDVSDRILRAAQTSTLFGGPVVAYGDPAYDSRADQLRPYDLSIAVAYPTKSQVVISNSATGDMWLTTFSLDEDDDGVTFSSVAPAELQVVAKNQEAMRSLRESGAAGVRAYPVRLDVQLREATTNDDGTIDVMAIRVGDGNPFDKNYYDESFIDDIVTLLPGVHSFRDHPTPTEEREQPARSIDRLAGFFSDPWKAEWTDPQQPGAPAVPAAFAKFHPTPSAVIEGLFRTQREKFAKYPDKEPFVAFSINAYGVGAPGENPVTHEPRNVTSRCTQLMSVDMVTYAGAAGRPMQESRSVKKPKNGKVALESRRIDPDAEIDIRTPDERAADRQTFLVEAQRAAIVDLFNGPAGKQIREAAGVADDADLSDSNAFTHAQVGTIADKLGLKKGGKMHTMMKDNLVEDDPEMMSEHDGDGEKPKPLAAAPVTREAIEAMTPEQLKAHALKSIESASPAASATSARELELERQISEMRATRAAFDRKAVIDRTLDTLQISGAHRVLAEASVPASADSNEAIALILRAYRDAHMLHPQGGGMHESRGGLSQSGGAGSLTFLRS